MTVVSTLACQSTNTAQNAEKRIHPNDSGQVQLRKTITNVFLDDCDVFPALLRYNRYITLYMFKMYNAMIYILTCYKMINTIKVNTLHFT